MESDDKYSKLELVEVAYGDDEPQKSTDQTQALLSEISGSETDLCADNSRYQRSSKSSSGREVLL